MLIKANDGPYWKRLLKDEQKYHWLKVDFNKWKDEDDSDNEDVAGGGDYEEMMRQMGGLGGRGMGCPNMQDMSDLDDKDGDGCGLDSDDDELPELEDK
jgi:cytosolic prostaglandin-E synthase